jgi:hypothetical protein
MPGDDHGHSNSGGWDTDDGSGVGSLGRDQGPATRWNTLESVLIEGDVRERIRRALRVSPPFVVGVVFSGAESEHGFLLTAKTGTQVVSAEVNLAGWDGGTQVHVALPSEARQENSTVVLEWLRRVLR